MSERLDPLRELRSFLAHEIGTEVPPLGPSRTGSEGETHFELGVAYAQMGLLEKALEELARAAEEPALRAPSAALLGSVHVARGEIQSAVDWYRSGLAVRGLPRRTRLGLLYDLGRAHLLAGDRRRASRAFRLAAEIDPGYRDLAIRRGEDRMSQEDAPAFPGGAVPRGRDLGTV